MRYAAAARRAVSSARAFFSATSASRKSSAVSGRGLEDQENENFHTLVGSLFAEEDSLEGGRGNREVI